MRYDCSGHDERGRKRGHYHRAIKAYLDSAGARFPQMFPNYTATSADTSQLVIPTLLVSTGTLLGKRRQNSATHADHAVKY